MEELKEVVFQICMIVAGLTTTFLIVAYALRKLFPYPPIVTATVPLMEKIKEEIPQVSFYHVLKLKRNWVFKTRTSFSLIEGHETALKDRLTQRLGRNVDIVTEHGKSFIVFVVEMEEHSGNSLTAH